MADNERTYGAKITNAGSALIADCILNGTQLSITEAAVGDGGGAYYQPTVDQTELKNETWRGEIASATVSATTANMIDVKIVVPADEGGYTVREAAIYSADGTMIAVCNTPDTEKVAISEGVSGQLTILMHLVVADTSVMQFVINPSLDTVSADDLAAAIQAHNEDPEAHPNLIARIDAITHTISILPSQSGSLTYNGNEQSPTWNNYNSDELTIGGQTSATEAGTYEATFTPKDGYTWDGEDASPRTVTWVIGRASIAAVPTQSNSLTYTGGAQSPTWSGYDTAQLTLGGTTTGTDAGSYNATFTPTSNYQWYDGSTGAKEAAWTIGRASISAVPSQSGTLTYTGSVQYPSWSNYNSAELTLGGQTSGVDAGTYTATFTPTSNYQWSGGGTGAQSVAWSIGKATGSLALSPQSLTLTTSTPTGAITAVRAGDGTISAQSSAPEIASVSVNGNTITVTGLAYGTAVITVSVAEGTNYTAPASQQCNVTVNLFSGTLESNSWASIRAASDAGDGANVWSVGDTKSITINGTVQGYTFSNLSVDVFITGFDHNASREGENKIHFQIGKINNTLVALCDDNYNSSGTTEGFRMNQSNTNVGGWADSYMRNTVLGNSGTPTSPPANSLLAALPSDLLAVMKPITKYTDNVGNGTGNVDSNISATTDYLVLYAEFEVFGTIYYANSYEQNYQVQYAYYQAGNSKIAYKHNATTTAVWRWLRSPYYYNSYSFWAVSTSGGSSHYTAYYSGGVAPGFAA